MLNVKAIRVQRHTNVCKQATLLDGLDVSPLKWRVCGCVLNRFVHEAMNQISNVEVHLKARSGNVNILLYLLFVVERAGKFSLTKQRSYKTLFYTQLS